MAKYAFDKVKFAKALHAERWGRGEGVREVAANIGCSPSTVSRWERALNEPPIVIFLVACGHYGLNPLDFIAKESDLQAVLPGFEALVDGELVPLSQLQLPENSEDFMMTDGDWAVTSIGDPWAPTKLTLNIDGTQVTEVWHVEIGWVILPDGMSVETWYSENYDGSEELSDGKLG